VDNVDLVRRFLRAQNLEQLGRPDEAVELYEETVAAGFDSSGPYDRLIALYGGRALHGEVIRIAESALANVQTHEEKRGWYAQVRTEAEEARRRVPPAAPRPRESGE
jgi:hypothetical protein